MVAIACGRLHLRAQRQSSRFRKTRGLLRLPEDIRCAICVLLHSHGKQASLTTHKHTTWSAGGTSHPSYRAIRDRRQSRTPTAGGNIPEISGDGEDSSHWFWFEDVPVTSSFAIQKYVLRNVPTLDLDILYQILHIIPGGKGVDQSFRDLISLELVTLILYKT